MSNTTQLFYENSVTQWDDS